MANENELMAEFAGNLWKNYLKPKITEEFRNNLSYYRATVVSNDGNGLLTVQRPYDTPIQLSCNESMTAAVAGDSVLVLCFGKGNAKNQFVLCYADMTSLAPASTDTKTTQSSSTTSSWRPLLFANKYASTATGNTTSSVTNSVYFNKNMTARLSDGLMHLPQLELATPLPIASGGTGASDAATARANLGIGSDTVYTASNTASSTVQRSGNVVTLTLYTGAQSWSAAKTTLGWTVPEGFRPTADVRFAGYTINSSGMANASVVCTVTTAGAVQVYPNGAVSASQAIGNASWITTDAEPSA